MSLPADPEMNPTAKNSGRTTASAVTIFNRRRCTAPRSGTSLSITCACAPISPEPTSARLPNSLSRHRAEACAITASTRIGATINPAAARRRRLLRVRLRSSQGAELDPQRCQCEHCCPCTTGPFSGCWDCKAHNRACRSHRNRPLPLDYIRPQSLAQPRCRCGSYQTKYQITELCVLGLNSR